jgi:hypothetical protein
MVDRNRLANRDKDDHSDALNHDFPRSFITKTLPAHGTAVKNLYRCRFEIGKMGMEVALFRTRSPITAQAV